MSQAPSTVNFKQWIDENRHLLKPPVGNKPIWEDGEMIVMVVGGPNARKDFHFNPTPEFFYQVEGDAQVTVRVGEAFETITIREGDVFLLPAKMPHSPKRVANTVGLVIEQKRPEGQPDGLQWYCENCGTLLYEEYFQLTNIGTQFKEVFDRYFGNEELRTCKKCGTVMEAPK